MLCLLTLLAAAPALADAPKYTRKQPPTPTVPLSERVKPKEPGPVEKPKPTLPPDTIMLIRDRQQPIRKEQEAILEKLVQATPDDDPDKPDIMFRLAEQYAQQQQHWRLKSIEATMPPRSRTDRTGSK